MIIEYLGWYGTHFLHNVTVLCKGSNTTGGLNYWKLNRVSCHIKTDAKLTSYVTH